MGKGERQRKHHLGPRAAGAWPGSLSKRPGYGRAALPWLVQKILKVGLLRPWEMRARGRHQESGAMLGGSLTVPPFITFSWPQVSKHI